MSKDDRAEAPAAGDERAARRQQSERLTRVMWAYICGAITLLSVVVGLGPTFIPLGFGVLGCLLARQLVGQGDRQHGVITGALALGGMMIWLTYNWHRYIG